MEREALVGDLYTFFNSPNAVRRGLDYRSIMKDLDDNFDNFESDGGRELYLTSILLESWKRHDLRAREEAGLTGEARETGLDYENQEKQIRWARMHARELNRLVVAKRAIKRSADTGTDPFGDILTSRVKDFLASERYKGEVL